MDALATQLHTSDGVTAQERENVIQHLERANSALAAAVTGLSPSQLNFKQAEDRWSVAEIMEHTAAVATRVSVGVLGKLAEGPAWEPGADPRQIDARILAIVPDRTTRITAPPVLAPTGQLTVPQALEQLDRVRTSLIEMLHTRQDLRSHTAPHPIMGPMDGYNWILAVVCHTERHLDQIREVKADPHFPTA